MTASETGETAVHDAYKRLLAPSMETETKLETKKRADEEAIRLFNENLRQLLLAPPLGQRNVMAIDPGFRTGCKGVCLDGRESSFTRRPSIPDTVSVEGAAGRGEKVRKLCRALT